MHDTENLYSRFRNWDAPLSSTQIVTPAAGVRVVPKQGEMARQELNKPICGRFIVIGNVLPDIENAPTGAILGLRTPDLDMKDVLLASDRGVFFTIPHFDGYPAVLIRLGKISSRWLWEPTLAATL